MSYFLPPQQVLGDHGTLRLSNTVAEDPTLAVLKHEINLLIDCQIFWTLAQSMVY
jgi:hypothetical protein